MVCLFIPWLFLEKSKMDDAGSWNFPPVILVLNCVCTFALNMSVFLVISRTSALTIRVTGVVRDWVVVLLSSFIFIDTKLTPINLLGYVIGNTQCFLFVFLITIVIFHVSIEIFVFSRVDITTN